MAGKVFVVQLVWGPLGDAVPQQFVDSYVAHPAGLEHELVVLFNGVDSPDEAAELRAPFASLAHRELVTPQSMLDLEAYRWAREALAEDPELIIFSGAHTKWLTDGWLEKFASSFDDPTVGMAACAGSRESILQSVGSARGRLRLARRFPRFPNPHLRTNLFAFSTHMSERVRWPKVRGKTDAWELENGRKSFYRQTLREGLRGVVVDADGKTWDERDWRASETFRSGDQANAIASDLRSEDYRDADREERKRLAALAWGSA